MSDIDIQRLVSVLEEIRDNQRLQLERQAEALSLQREQYALVQKQHERASGYRIAPRQSRRRAPARRGIAQSFRVVLPIIIVLVIYLSWILFRR